MSQKILVMAGPKQSGKSSAVNFIHGHLMMKNGVIGEFGVGPKGELIVPPIFTEGEYEVLDVDRHDLQFSLFALEHIWPSVKAYSFAYHMKEFVINVFGLSREKIYGSEEDKNEDSPLKWSAIASFLPPRTKKKLADENKLDQYMTNREVLQYFGTEIIRKIDENAWVNSTFRDIKNDGFPFATVSDCRFENELEVSRENGARIIRCKGFTEGKHSSETSLDNIPDEDFDLVLEKDKLTLEEKNQLLLEKLTEWEFV